MNWLAFFMPILTELAKLVIKAIYDLVEKWAEAESKKPESEDKKEKAVMLAKQLGVQLDDDQLDAAIEMVHQASQVERRRVGKAKA